MSNLDKQRVPAAGIEAKILFARYAKAIWAKRLQRIARLPPKNVFTFSPIQLLRAMSSVQI
jgi:hypothetical protein